MRYFFKSLSFFKTRFRLKRFTSAAEVEVLNFERAAYVKAAWHLLMIGLGGTALIYEPADASSSSITFCEQMLSGDASPSSDLNAPTVDSNSDGIGLSPNEVEQEILTRITHAYQNGWLKEASDLNGMIKSPTPILPPLNWTDLEIGGHKQDWLKALDNENVRWNVVQQLLRQLQSQLQNAKNLIDESSELTANVMNPLFLGEIGQGLEFKGYATDSDGSRLSIIWNPESKEAFAVRLNAETLHLEAINPDKTDFLAKHLFRLPDGSYISASDTQTTTSADASDLTKKSISALEKYKSQTTGRGEIAIKAMTAIDGVQYLAVLLHRSWNPHTPRDSRRVVLEFAFLPLDQDATILTIASDSILTTELTSVNDLSFYLDEIEFEELQAEAHFYGIWKLKQAIWVFDFKSKRPVNLFGSNNSKPVHFFPHDGKFEDQEFESQIIQAGKCFFLLCRYFDGRTRMFDLNRLSVSASSEIFLGDWNPELAQSHFLRVVGFQNKGYIFLSEGVREFEISASYLSNKKLDEIPFIAKVASNISQDFFSLKNGSVFDSSGSIYFFMVEAHRLSLMDTRGNFRFAKMPNGATLSQLIGVFHHKSKVLALARGGPNLYLIQLIGPENATLEDYKDLLPKLEAK